MIQLKGYQQRVLDSLGDYLSECAQSRLPAPSFEKITSRVYGFTIPYIPVVDPRFSNMPYVCIRVPTGGGKTLLACHTVGIALNKYLQSEHSLVLWLVPSNTILNQTADALRDPRHPYRRALEMECAGPVEVVTIEEALRLSRATVEGQTVVIVSTIQCFRVADPEGRKVYDGDNTFMAEHMASVPPDRYKDMDMGSDGKPIPSLINLLKFRRPIVIVDEAHNARTDLSFTTLANVLPSCIIEYTATPDAKKNPSNVLHRVSAAELKAEDMVKLPLRVITRHPGQKEQLLAEAIALRSDLEKLANREAQEKGEYIRPIVLIQSDRVDSCAPLREKLVNEFKIDRDYIKISTGKLDELKGIIDISSQECPVRFIITVEKLREGWDCPFAYVLCSLRETRSATAIEQIVGRILRLPKASPKSVPELNCAYVFALSESNRLEEVLSELRDALVSNGFTASEAQRIILPVSQPLMPLGVQPQTIPLPPEHLNKTILDASIEKLTGKVSHNKDKNELTIYAPLSQEDEEIILSCVNNKSSKGIISEAVEKVRQIEKVFGNGEPRQVSPFERQLDFFVPLLSVREDDMLSEFERTHIIEHPWNLGSKDATLNLSYDPRIRPDLRVGMVDVDKNSKVVSAVSETNGEDFIGRLHQEVMEFAKDEDWPRDRLISWIDNRIEHRDIPPHESVEFLEKCITGLMTRLGINDTDTLGMDRFRLRDHIDELISRHRNEEHKAVFEKWLLPNSKLTVSPEKGIDFKNTQYEPSWLYEGGFKFKNHYYGKPGELKDGTEEFKCAQFLDNLSDVKHWIRNLSRKPSSFRLQTSTDWFYPDFVCLLKDGRLLVVEYKGGNVNQAWYAMKDSEEKRTIGAVWESRSKGKCLFIMPQGQDWEAIKKKIAK